METAKSFLALADSGLFVNRVSPEPKYRALQNNTKVPKRLREKFQNTLDSWYYFFTGNGLSIAMSKVALEEAVKSCNDTTNFTEYKIKARIKENGVSDVKEFFAIVKNNDYDNIIIQDHKITVDECPDSIQNLMESIEDFVKWYSKDTEYYMQLLAVFAECDPYLE